MNHFKNFAEKHMENKESNVINFLSSNRKIHKYAFMCFAYNQKYYGRIDDFKQFWIDEFKRLPNKEEYKTLSEFAKNYESFLDNVFPNCCKKLKLLEDLVDLMINDSGFVEILTLEGDVLRWSFLKSEHKTRTKYDPINKKSIKYTINAICEKKLPDKLAHKRRFLSYVIHSIDAAVMRYYIRKMHEKKNYIINHLHDCVILHPNFVDDFYEIVEELYKSDKLYNIIDNLIFEQMRTSLSITSRLKLDEIKAKYILLCDDFKNEINFESKNIYKFET